MRSYIADRARISLILTVFSIPLVGMYVAQHYEDWAFADLSEAIVPEQGTFRDISSDNFVDQVPMAADREPQETHFAGQPR
jgi:hypothetical protein